MKQAIEGMCTSLLLAAFVLSATLAACGPKDGITETRMIQAPSREPSCALKFVQVNATSMAFNQTWDLLGYVAFSDSGTQDPMAEENRKLVRPRACKMGGTAIAVSMNATSTGAMGQQGSALLYMVLRPKSRQAAQPTAF